MKLVEKAKAVKENLSSRVEKLADNHKSISLGLKIREEMVDENAGLKVGAITYYMFLSLLPLMLFSLTVFDIVFASNPDIRDRLIDSTLASIPIVGSTLESNLTFVSAQGTTLITTMLVMLWATKKGALALQSALYSIMKNENVKKQRNFASKNARAYLAMFTISIGLVAPTVFNSLAWDSWVVRIVVVGINLVWNVASVYLIFTILVSSKKAKEWGTVVAGVLITAIQFLSILVVGNTLDNARPLYGTLAVVLALLVWLSLQIRALVYGAIINSVLIESK